MGLYDRKIDVLTFENTATCEFKSDMIVMPNLL